MRTSFFILIFILFNLFSFGQNQVGFLNEDAKIKMQEKDFEGAIKSLTLSLKIDSSNAGNYTRRGTCYETLNKVQQAYNDFSKALIVDPFYSKAYFERGKLLRAAKKYVESVADLNQAVRYAEHDSLKYKYYGLRATVNFKLRNFKSSELDLMYRYKIDSFNIETLNDLGMVQHELGNKKASFNSLNKVIKIDPKNTIAYSNLGYYSLLDSNYIEAIRYLDITLVLDPKFSYAYNNRGFCKLMMADLTGATNDINKSIKLDKTNSYAYKNLALVDIKKGDLKAACKNLNESQRLKFTEQFGEEVLHLLSLYCK